MADELVVQNQQSVGPMQLIQLGIERGIDSTQLQAIMDFAERLEIMQDKTRFREAMVQFHATCPSLIKDTKVKYQNKDNTWTEYNHASIGNVAETIGKALAAVGVSHSWTTDDTGPVIAVTCTLSLGAYSESTTLSAPPDSSGGKNVIQARISTKSYLERHTLTGITGTATNEAENDGNPPATANADLLDAVEKISRAPNTDTLAAIYKDAYTKNKADKIASRAIVEAKDKRKKELAEAGPA